MDIIKIIGILLFFDFIGFLINESFFKFKEKLYILYGFIFLVAMVQLYSVPFIFLHVNIMVVNIIFIILSLVTIFLCLKRVDIKKYALIKRLKSVPKSYIVLYVVFGLVLSTLSFVTNDQWLYNSFILSSFGDGGIYSVCGSWYCDNLSAQHIFNSYYLFNAIIISLINANPLDFVYGLYRFVDGMVIFQTLILITYFFKTKRKYALALLVSGILGCVLFSNSPYNEGITLLVLNGANGTTLYEMVFCTFIIKYLVTKKNGYLYLIFPFGFAITTTVYIINIFILIILKFMKYEIPKGLLILIGYLYSINIVTKNIAKDTYITLVLLMLIIWIAVFAYSKINGKIQLILIMGSLIFMNIIVYINNILLYNDLALNLSIRFVTFLLVIVLMYTTKDVVDKNITTFSILIILFTILVPRFTLKENDLITTLVTNTNVISERILYLFPFQIYIINFLFLFKKKIILIVIAVSFYVSFISLMYQELSMYLSIPEYIVYKSKNIDTHLINTDIEYINSELEKKGYPMTELYFHEFEPTLWPRSEVPNTRYIPALVPNTVTIYDDSEDKEFCQNSDTECYELYNKNQYFFEEGEYNAESYNYYIVKVDD